ncbi:MAG: RagB/SusD family nutrient uptake outer membrane protein, partial [Rikenellaceae bacterium]|nr:RagB/SusD family nutrient uptake outer membrane protein [Rikenellaceae bacterium]MCL2693199.1 RagB/SusD family nutrient uptake outer membrane protein [Rikenellaceae bacterium]
TLGVQIGGDNTEQSFFYNAYRNRRMNYYAVMALKMRACMYAGTEEKIAVAGQIAKELIESQSFQETFPWGSRDPIYSDEVIFGIHVHNMYDEFINWFSPSNTRQFSALPTTNGLYRYMFRQIGSADGITPYDERFAQWLRYGETNWITAKFRRPADDASYIYYQPLIRKSEVYLTAAEVFQDPAYLDELRVNRGKLPLLEEGDNYNLQDEILREWMRDFVSEGQLFYYYKRRAQTSIINYNGAPRSMSIASYMPYLPDVETER